VPKPSTLSPTHQVSQRLVLEGRAARKEVQNGALGDVLKF